jgi:hypothetical protein
MAYPDRGTPDAAVRRCGHGQRVKDRSVRGYGGDGGHAK